ncbi:hypothetical protein [Streptomyces sp. NPDC090022]|uniref:hypothetical protein n=1 Tax=Streptomyces sp. NPDC090022 TaxID=3365920 RepID=UPI0037F12727
MSVETRGGRLTLVRGGAAQEFTVTVRNGNTQAYDHLLLTFQMEILFGGGTAEPTGPGPGFVLERKDPATGAWRPATLRIANDSLPNALLRGGTPLPRDTTRTEHYRLRALRVGAAGSTPVMIRLVDTDTDRSVATFNLPTSTARR